MSDESNILDYAQPATPKPTTWPVAYVLVGLIVVFVLQSLFLPCLCERGTVKMNIGMAVDGVVLIRLVIAGVRRERGRGWIAYLLLAASTLVWVPWVIGD